MTDKNVAQPEGYREYLGLPLTGSAVGAHWPANESNQGSGWGKIRAVHLDYEYS